MRRSEVASGDDGVQTRVRATAYPAALGETDTWQAAGRTGLELTAWIRPLKGFLNSPPIFGSTLTVELNKQQKRVPTILPHKGKQSSTV